MRNEGRWSVILPVLVALVLVLIWSAMAAAGLFPPSAFPAPTAVFAAFVHEAGSGRLFNDIVTSLFRVCCGFLIAAGLGIPIGVWMGQMPALRLALLPLTNFFRNLSPLAWMPFAILWLGVGDAASIFLIFLSVFFPVVLATLAAVAGIPSVHFRVARSYGLRGLEKLVHVTLPAIMPHVITTLRVAAGVAWLVDVAAEMIAGRDGLGFAVMDSRNGLRTDILVVEMIVIGLIGVLIDRVLSQLTTIPSVRWDMSANLMAREARIDLSEICLSFGAVEVLRNISITTRGGEFVAIVGPSGCGKSTLLNVMSGEIAPLSGSVVSQGQVRMVYQEDGLFPWQTVSENILLGLRSIAEPGQRTRQLNDLLRLIGLQGFEEHYPHQLSGGMRQRVELARAMAGDSDILLMDEPFSSLDYLTRLRMRGEVARLLEGQPRTVVLVTHDIEEAAQLADRVIVLTDRPAQIRREILVRAPRPRDLTDPIVVDTTRRVLAELDMPTTAEVKR